MRASALEARRAEVRCTTPGNLAAGGVRDEELRALADDFGLADLATKLGIEQTIIEGRRVTDDATLEMAKMIFAGKINTDILAALRHRGEAM